MEFDDDRFFSGASRGDYLDALTAHAGLGSVVVVEGDEGSGVSTLLGQAVMALLDDLEVVRIDGGDEHDANVVIDALLRHFNIERAELPETLRSTLADGRIVVVVDNAEQLSPESLATMASLKQKLAGRLGYFFGGLPGVIERIKAADFAVDDVLNLPVLMAEDVQDFAWFVLGMELDDKEAEAQRELSDGNLSALLKSLTSGGEVVATDADDHEVRFGALDPEDESEFDVDQAVDVGYEDQDSEVEDRAAPPWRHISAVAGLLIVVVLLWVGLSSEPDSDSELTTRALDLPVPAAEMSDAESAPVQEDSVQPMEPTMEPVARLEDLESREAPARQEGGVILEPVADPVMQSDPPPKDPVMVLEEKAPDVEPVEAPPQEKAAVAEEPLVDDKGYQHAGWLASLNDDRWFLQITATSQQEGARRVLDDVQRKGAYYEAERNGKTVWLVLSGDYSSRQAALDAKASLPAKLREAGPFPRKMGDIRSEL
ncbi:hypothetical protein Y5S_02378 [Alcanivorax nanhaiticus]|uniref:SPOR domain-containing protein n=1 Tax=Alcanivorax nanhaiticus TaxID=1177154 RepID=A0A095TPJ0_9GAMM|nr:SPOR domain-containing protein [Alcanivorax nanhaiticus]KGD64323.1 hypothetical protein Y5S_02378 [Alcanivorax nanhaiticus]